MKKTVIGLVAALVLVTGAFFYVLFRDMRMLDELVEVETFPNSFTEQILIEETITERTLSEYEREVSYNSLKNIY